MSSWYELAGKTYTGFIECHLALKAKVTTMK